MPLKLVPWPQSKLAGTQNKTRLGFSSYHYILGKNSPTLRRILSQLHEEERRKDWEKLKKLKAKYLLLTVRSSNSIF
jgi:hypothetical protein